MALGMARRSKSVAPGHRPGRQDAPLSKRIKTMDSSRTSVTSDLKQENSAESMPKLLFSMDYGTKTLSMAYRIVKPGEAPNPMNVRDVHFSERDYFAPQVVAWGQDGTFHWGYDVERALKRNTIKEDSVLTLWKLLLYKNHVSSDMAKQVESQLGERSLEQLISTHLAAVVLAAKGYVKNTQNHDYSAEDIDELPVQLLLSVPQMWKAPANRIMTQAARAAEIAYVELVYEPQCAAACYTHNIRDRLPKQLQVGDVILIADVGGGTGDFVSYEVRTDCENGARVGLKSVGAAHGALCGSEFVTQNFIKWMKREAGDFETKCRALGLTPTEVTRKAGGFFESMKQSFSGADALGSEYIAIRGAQGAREKWFNLELSNDDIAGFFDPVIDHIIRCIDGQRTERTRTLIIPGGFGRSEYLLNRLQKQYGNSFHIQGQASAAVGAYQPVSRGALLRYKDIEPRGVPSKESFGIGQVESFDEHIHLDAVTLPENVGGRKPRKRRLGPRINKDIVEKDPYDGRDVVYERWMPIMTKDAIKVPGKPFTQETWQYDIVPIYDQTIRVQIYSTELPINQHEAILLQGSNVQNGIIKPGIEPWGPRLEKRLPDLGKQGFESFDLEDSEVEGPFFELYYRLMLECDGANINIMWQIALPGTQPYYENGEYQSSDNVQLADGQMIELCDGAHNPFPRVSPS